MNKVPKYGFGMSPISLKMQNRYDVACTGLLSLLSGERVDTETVLEYLSDFKGMCNRCVKQDQWDWFTVYSAFGSPEVSRLKVIASVIPTLRSALRDEDARSMGEALAKIERADARSLISSFLKGACEDGGGWIYILSTRDAPTILKIGMTTRTVDERVKEINASTGVLYPYSARAAFRVDDPGKTERAIHLRLAECRIRPDREFFDLEFKDAQRAICDVIKSLRPDAEQGVDLNT